MSEKLREEYRNQWWEKMTKDKYQGHFHFIWEDHEKDYTRWLEYKLVSINTPKHETVEQWESRTGETYPDDAPVWRKHRSIGSVWIVDVYEGLSTEAYDLIVANHHGKPDIEDFE